MRKCLADRLRIILDIYCRSKDERHQCDDLRTFPLNLAHRPGAPGSLPVLELTWVHFTAGGATLVFSAPSPLRVPHPCVPCKGGRQGCGQRIRGSIWSAGGPGLAAFARPGRAGTVGQPAFPAEPQFLALERKTCLLSSAGLQPEKVCFSPRSSALSPTSVIG